MGSTGHGKYGKYVNTDSETFGIDNAVVFKGRLPAVPGFKENRGNNITLKLPADRKNNVLFQFSLSKDERFLNVTGFYNGEPEVRTKVSLDVGSPSLNKLLASGSATERRAALKMKELMSRSSSMDETQLSRIALELKSKHRR